ncbi:hypothetical protein T4A_1543 [Trichinella pseudospiralis]|uniref:Uncharacterized protein n=1 Tax=Trichinella pseudospiralis TaxID=6337 RepID=A0A0V1EHT5_TRIPS|nr:hypothetical protein T4A_1543 [Trichinella pseudospiralis]
MPMLHLDVILKTNTGQRHKLATTFVIMNRVIVKIRRKSNKTCFEYSCKLTVKDFADDPVFTTWKDATSKLKENFPYFQAYVRIWSSFSPGAQSGPFGRARSASERQRCEMARAHPLRCVPVVALNGCRRG